MLKCSLHVMFTALVLSLLTFASRAQAQAGGAATVRSGLELEHASLVGPGAEVVAGGLILGAAPPLALLAGFMAGPGITLCEDDDETQCTTTHDSRSVRTAWGVGLSLAALGGVLVGHGAHRIRQIRIARRGVDFQTAMLELEQGHAKLGLRFSF